MIIAHPDLMALCSNFSTQNLSHQPQQIPALQPALWTGHPRESGNLRKGQLAANASCKANFLHNIEGCLFYLAHVQNLGIAFLHMTDSDENLQLSNYIYEINTTKMVVITDKLCETRVEATSLWNRFLCNTKQALSRGNFDVTAYKPDQWFAVPTMKFLSIFRVLVYVYLTRQRKKNNILADTRACLIWSSECFTKYWLPSLSLHNFQSSVRWSSCYIRVYQFKCNIYNLL